jgi:tetraacyldisaccharide 4'-kinase
VPLYQGPDRVELAGIACAESDPNILVLDDGFQHRRLKRDLDIVLIDATDPAGNRYLLPRGTLREPMRSLRRAHAAILTHADQLDASALGVLKTRVERHLGAGLIAVARHKPLGLASTDRRVAPLETMKEHPVGGFCGIGNPRGFRRTLEMLGASIVDFRIFSDHHEYTREVVEDLCAWAGRLPKDAVIATTQKDFVKLTIPELGGRPLWAVRIGMDFLEGEDTFQRLLLDEIRE